MKDNPEYQNGFCEYFVQGKAAEIEDQFNEFLDETISIRDSGEEKFYYAYLLGMLRNRKDWRLKSNRKRAMAIVIFPLNCPSRNWVSS